MYTKISRADGPGVASAHDIYEWFVLHAEFGASHVGLEVLPIYPEVGDDIVEFCERWNLNQDIAAAIIAHESAYLQSHIYRAKKNPAGLGATNDNPGENAIEFATERGGIRATIAHMAVYVYGEGEWTQYDPRYEPVKEAGWLGIVDILEDFNGRWAWPGTTYADRISEKASSLVSLVQSRGSFPPSILPGRDILGVPLRISILARNKPNNPNQPLSAYEGITQHETANFNAGANAEMHRRFVHNGGGAENVSFHFVVDEDEIIQLLPLNKRGVHGGSHDCNFKTWGIELCVNSDGDFNKTMKNGANLVRYLWEYWPDVDGKIRQHNACSGKNCPLLMRQGRWEEFLALIGDTSKPAPDPNAEKYVYPGDGQEYWIVNGYSQDGEWVAMLDFYREMGGMPRLGYPVEGMRRRDDGPEPVYIQRTENVLMECWINGFGAMPGPYYRFGRTL